MAVSRPFLLALIGVLLAAATFVASRNAREVAEEDGAKPAAAVKAPSDVKLAPQGSVKSGVLRVTADIDAPGAPGADSATVTGRGRFQSRGRDQVPAFDFRFKMRGGSERFDAGAVSTGRRAFVIESGRASELPAALWSELRSARSQLASAGATKQESTGLLGPGTDGAVKDFKREGAGTAGGVLSDRYSGTLEPAALLAAVERYGNAGGAQLPAGIKDQVDEAVPELEIEFWVGQKDRILRRLSADARIRLPESVKQQSGGAKHLDVKFDFELSEVNRPQTVTAPASTGALRGQARDDTSLSISTAALAAGVMAVDAPPGAARSAGATGRKRRVPTKPPPAFERAVASGRPVALFVYQPGADDDRKTAEAVAALRKRKVLVFRDEIGNVGRYAQLLQSVSVTQAPSVVIIGPGRKARLVEGYVDPETLAQELVDTRR